MTTIICGEDSVSSRNYFFQLKKEYQQKGFETKIITTADLANNKSIFSENLSLFSKKIIYFSENLYSKKTKWSDELFNKKQIDHFDWEDSLSARDIRLSKNSNVKIKEFKPSQNIFRLLDSCYPKNLKTFIATLHNISDSNNEHFIFLMLSRHIRKLILIALGLKPQKLADWQIYKLKKQASFWKLNELISFYEGLQKIDQKVKTSRNPFSLIGSLDILSVYFL